MSPEEKAKEIGIEFPEIPKLYLNLCIRTGNLLMTSGHVSDIKGKLGKDLSVEEGYAAAKECAIKILQSVHHEHGTLDGLRCIKIFGCVNSTQDFTDQHLVINGCSDFYHEVVRLALELPLQISLQLPCIFLGFFDCFDSLGSSFSTVSFYSSSS